jgi:hypothetical protein
MNVNDIWCSANCDVPCLYIYVCEEFFESTNNSPGNVMLTLCVLFPDHWLKLVVHLQEWCREPSKLQSFPSIILLWLFQSSIIFLWPGVGHQWTRQNRSWIFEVISIYVYIYTYMCVLYIYTHVYTRFNIHSFILKRPGKLKKCPAIPSPHHPPYGSGPLCRWQVQLLNSSGTPNALMPRKVSELAEALRGARIPAGEPGMAG